MTRKLFFHITVITAIVVLVLSTAGCPNPNSSSEGNGSSDTNGDVEESGWYHHKVASNDDSGKDSSIVIDGNDVPHILYQRQVGSEYYARYATPGGSGWIDELVETAGGETEVARQSLALVGGGDLHAAIYHLANDDLGHAERSGGSWSTEKPPEGSHNNTGFSASVAVDSYGYPHISHLRTPSSGSWKLLYTYEDASGWNTTVVDNPDATSTLNIRGFTAIALDTNGNPHIAYSDYTGPLKYAYYDGIDWQREVVMDTVDIDFAPTGIALDSSGTPYIVATRKDSYDYSTLLARRTGADDAWQSEEISPVYSENAAIAIDGSDRVHVSYVRESHLEYAVRDSSGTWSVKIVDDTRHVDWFTSIALDSQENPHISYYDEQYEDLWYVYWKI